MKKILYLVMLRFPSGDTPSLAVGQFTPVIHLTALACVRLDRPKLLKTAQNVGILFIQHIIHVLYT